MRKPIVNDRGRVVIPARLRKKYGIKKGTRISFYERRGEIVIKPITDEYIRAMAVMTDTKGELLKSLTKKKYSELLHNDQANMHYK